VLVVETNGDFGAIGRLSGTLAADPGVAAMLPRDGGAGEGFDNVGAAQPMTPMHLRAYIAAAKLVVAHARIFPFQPIEWLQTSRVEARTPQELEREVMNGRSSRSSPSRSTRAPG
jgi:hypothetical protein